MPEEARGPWDSGCHESKFAEQPLPFLDANAPFVAVIKYGMNATFPSVSEFQSPPRGVQDPSEDFLALTPPAFAFQELLL